MEVKRKLAEFEDGPIHDVALFLDEMKELAASKYGYAGPIVMYISSDFAYDCATARVEVYFYQEETQAEKEHREAVERCMVQNKLEFAHRQINSLAKDLGYRVELFPLKLD